MTWFIACNSLHKIKNIYKNIYVTCVIATTLITWWPYIKNFASFPRCKTRFVKQLCIAIHVCNIVFFHVSSYKNLFLYSIVLTTVFLLAEFVSRHLVILYHRTWRHLLKYRIGCLALGCCHTWQVTSWCGFKPENEVFLVLMTGKLS